VLNDKNHCVGLLDKADICAYASKFCLPGKKFSFGESAWKGAVFKAHSIKDILDYSKHNIAIHVNANGTLVDAIHKMGLAVRRVVLDDDEGRCIRLLTQTDVLKYLSSHIHLFGSKITGTILEFPGLMRFPVVSAFPSDSFSSCLLKMSEQGVSCLPVVDSSNVLQGMVSTSDLKSMLPNYFFENVKNHVSTLGSVTKRQLPVTCLTSTSIRDMVDTLLKNEVHHLVVVDDCNVVQGIVSPMNLIYAVAEQKISTSFTMSS
jgi:CBS-domain-containing membrane protein